MKRQSVSLPAAAAVAVVATATALMSLWTPPQIDDLVFAHYYTRYNGGETGLSWSALWRFILDMRQGENGRLANVVAPLFTVVAGWRALFPWLTGLLWGAAVWLAARLACGTRPGWRPVAVMAGALLLFLPWRDHIFVWDYSLNYIWPSPMALALMLLTVRATRRRFTAATAGAAILLGLLTGLWHEGFSLTVLCGLALLAAVKKLAVPWQYWAVMASLVAGTAGSYLCPGMLDRTGMQLFMVEPVTLRSIADAAAFLLLALTVAALALTCLWGAHAWRRRVARALGDPVFVVAAAAALAGFVMALLVQRTARMSFWPDLCSIVALGRLAALLWHPRRALKTAIAALAALLYTGVMAQAIVWQHRLHDEDRAIKAKIEASPDGTVFHDIILPRDIPVTTLYLPSRTAWVQDFNLIAVSIYYGRFITRAPSAMRDMRGFRPFAGGRYGMLGRDIVGLDPLPVPWLATVRIQARLRGEPAPVAFDGCALNVNVGGRFMGVYLMDHLIPLDRLEGIDTIAVPDGFKPYTNLNPHADY